MDIEKLINQLVESISDETERNIFVETLKTLKEEGEELSVDDVLSLYENVGNSNNEVDGDSYKRGLASFGNSDSTLVTAEHKKMNDAIKAKQDASGLKTKGESMEDLFSKKEKSNEYADKLNNAVKEKQDKSKLKEDFVDVTEDINKIFEGADFSDDFKEKAQTILEGSIKSKINEHFEELDEAVAGIINEELETIQEEMEDQLQRYLEYIVEQFMEENSLQVESGIKSELAESVLRGFKDVLIENNITIPEEKEDIVESVVEENGLIKESYNKEVERNINLLEEVKVLKKERAIAVLSEELTDVESDKLASLLEGIEFVNEENFVKKAMILKEAYTKGDTVTVGQKILHEDYDPVTDEPAVLSADVEIVKKSLDRITRR